MLVIIDYGLGNIGSIVNMIRKVGYECVVSCEIEKIRNATKIILPGVGAFDSAMKRLSELSLIDVLKEKVIIEKTPIIGICLGMQLMTFNSEEGKIEGLGFINAVTKKFNLDEKYKIPHMGWNTVSLKKDSKLFYGMENRENRFYFVHSYYAVCSNPYDVLTTSNYGGIEFVSSFEKENIIGVQFHPEKSHKFGMQLIKNFVFNY